jgi:4-hydroxybenzoate polyprenyltransferase
MRQLLAYLQLCRAANVFTALADIALGFLMTQSGKLGPAGWESLPWTVFGWLLASSACLYTAGMVWNDVFDRDVDRRERPERPIPSGRISVRNASILGTLLLVGGIASASLAGTPSALVAAILVACILTYDGLVKSTPAGPVFMGGCRFLNVMLGASVVDAGDDFVAAAAEVWTRPQLLVAAALGIYIAGVTWFAREEADVSRRGPLGAAIAVINLGLASLITLLFLPDVLGRRDLHGNHLNIAIVLGLISLAIDRRLLAAWYNPDAQHVRFAIKVSLLSLVILDAALVVYFTGQPWYGAAVVTLLIPSLLLSRVLAMT